MTTNGAVIQDARVVGYLTAALRAGVYAVRNILNTDKYKEVHGYDSIPVDMEAPNELASYPYVHVMYRPRALSPISLEETRFIRLSEDESESEMHVYRFEGTYMLNLYATTILERETLSDCIIGAVGIDDDFHRLLTENDWIAVAPNMHTLSLGNSNESWGTPWSVDTMTAFRQLTFDVIGEFCYRKVDVVRYIESIRLRDQLA